MEAAKDLLVVRKDRVGVSLDVVEDLIVDGQQYLPNPGESSVAKFVPASRILLFRCFVYILNF